MTCGDYFVNFACVFHVSSDSSTFISTSLAALDAYFPDWDQWNALDARTDRQTILIPSSYDLLKQFVGPIVEDVAGFNLEQFLEKKHSIVGDACEKDFYDAVEKLKLGGILIGGLKVEDIISKRPLYDMGQPRRRDDSFNRGLRNDADLFSKIKSSLRAKNFKSQEMDFIYIHPAFGLFLIECKHGGKAEHKTKAISQLERIEKILKIILRDVSKDDNVDELLFKKMIYVGVDQTQSSTEKEQFCLPANVELLTDETINDREKLRRCFTSKVATYPGNIFKDNNFRSLIAILVGCRPDIFISPVKCVLHWNHLIDNHQIRSIFSKEQMCHQLIKDAVAMKYRTAKNRLKSSSQNTAFTAQSILDDEFPMLNSRNIKFVGKDANEERMIYFTDEQRKVILHPAQRLIITGVPGSGKSLILMMRIFIAAQDESRRAIPIEVITAPRHQSEYSAFLNANSTSFIREWNLAWARETNATPFALDRAELRDCFSDEVYPNQIAAYCRLLKGNATLVLSSVHEKQHDLREAMQLLHCTTIDLRTHFRGTKQIAKYWQRHFLRDAEKCLIVGHDFDGIAPEVYTYAHIAECITAMRDRIRRLKRIEGCSRDDFAISFANLAEMDVVEEKLNGGNYDFYLDTKTAPTFPQDAISLIAVLIEDWKREFTKCFKSPAKSDAERSDSLADFCGYGLIALEAKRWHFCDTHLIEKITQTYQFLIAEMKHLLNKANRKAEWEWREGKTTELLVAMLSSLSLYERLLQSPSSFRKCWEINFIEQALPLGLANATSILYRKRHKSEIYVEMAKYFQDFRIVNSRPRMFESLDLPSMQFPIQILFTIRKNAGEHAPDSPNYDNFLSVALSR